jgi:DNA polymerase alpha subunit A
MPPLNILSLSVRTIVNYQDNKREVVCATTRIWQNSAYLQNLFRLSFKSVLVQIDDPTPPEQLKCSVNTFIRPLDKFPQNFEKQAKSSSKGAIVPAQNERMLLSSLLSKPTYSSKYCMSKLSNSDNL